MIQLWLLWCKYKNAPIIFACKAVKLILSFHSANIPQIFISLAYISTVSELLPLCHSTIASNGPRSSLCQGFTIIFRHTTFGRTPLGEWSALHKKLYLPTTLPWDKHLLYQWDLNPNSSKRTAADPRLRPRSKWGRLGELLQRKQLHSNEGRVSSKYGPLTRWGSEMLVNRWH